MLQHVLKEAGYLNSKRLKLLNCYQTINYFCIILQDRLELISDNLLFHLIS